MFWKKRPPTFNAAEHIGRLLLAFPRCPQRIIAIDGILDESFDCAFVLASDELLRWLEEFVTKVMVCGEEPQATQAAFIMWLRSADRGDFDSITRMPAQFFGLYRSHATELVKETEGHVYCPICETGHCDTNVCFENRQDEGGSWYSGVETWYCPRGHRLRHAPYRGHLLLRSD